MRKWFTLTAMAVLVSTSLASCLDPENNSTDPAVTSIPNPFKNLRWGNGYWTVAQRSVPGNYAVVPDPETGTGAVQRFTLRQGDCGGEDCRHNSGRFEFMEDVWDHPSYGPQAQPREAWYSWEVRLDEGTLYGRNQPIGPMIVGQFKQGALNCPLIILKHQSGYNDNSLEVMLSHDTGRQPPHDCATTATETIGSVTDLIGRWARVEMFVRWSSDADGRVEVFFNGARRMNYTGPTCIGNCEDIYRKYGLYFANQRGGTPLTEINAYYRNLGRSATREGLPR
ncbi:polysaccharide lyase [Yoonia sp.]|nr:polysaccharide lyase [Yoonia sp.]